MSLANNSINIYGEARPFMDKSSIDRLTAKLKGNAMKNKHPHHDLMVELIGDTSKKVFMITATGEESEVYLVNVASDMDGRYEFKIKPREFQKGHWYPCYYDDGTFFIKRSSGRAFYSSGDYSSIAFYEGEFKSVGESLGDSLCEIKFK